MKVLGLGTDARIARPGGDAAYRQRAYARRLERLVQAVAVPPAEARPPFDPFPDSPLTVVPVAARGRLGAFVALRAAGDRLLAEARRAGRPFDLVVTQDPLAVGLVGVGLGRRHGVPVCVHHHSDFFGRLRAPGATWGDRLRASLAVAVSRRADGVRVLSPSLAARAAAAGVPADRILIAFPPPPPFEPPPAEAVEAARRRLDLDGDPVLLFVGRLSAEKRVDALLRLLPRWRRRFPDVELLLAGDGPTGAALRGVAARVEGVRFLGEVEPTDLPALYGLADLLLLPSRYEGVPKVLLEAARCGLPAVATAVGAVPDVVEDGRTGRVVPPGDDEAFAAAVEAALDDAAWRRTAGAAARERAAALFDVERGVEAVVEAWRRTAAVRRP